MKAKFLRAVPILSLLVCLICLWQVAALKKQVTQLQTNLSSQISRVDSSVQGISSQVYYQLEKEASLLSDSSYEYGSFDEASQSVLLDCSVTPKEFSPENTQAFLVVQEGGESREEALTLENGSFTAHFSLSIFSDCEIPRVIFREGDIQRTEALDWYLSPRQELLPGIDADLYGSSSMSDGLYCWDGTVELNLYVQGEGPLPEIQGLRLLELVDGEEVGSIPVDQNSDDFNWDGDDYYYHASFPMEREVSLSPYDRYELQLEIDTGDFFYRVILDRWQADGEGSGQPDSSFTGWNSEPMVYDSQGQLLYSPLFD
ncbi:MAG: hypothetical protein MR579_04045 [Bacteroidales bacterium]|nr:hypothetical protein [Bacteroidales bacterium]